MVQVYDDTTTESQITFNQDRKKLLDSRSLKGGDSVNSEEVKLALRYDPGSDSAHSSFTDGRTNDQRGLNSNLGS